MGNGEYVPWSHMREHELESRERSTKITTLETEVKYLRESKDSMEDAIKHLEKTQGIRHDENRAAINSLSMSLTAQIVESDSRRSVQMAESDSKQSRMYGIGFGVLGTLNIVLIIIGLVIAYTTHG